MASPTKGRGVVHNGDEWRPDVDVFSPDRTVRLLADRAGELSVEVQNLHRHDEQTLAGQVRAAARVALAALQDRPATDEPGQGARAGSAGSWS